MEAVKEFTPPQCEGISAMGEQQLSYCREKMMSVCAAGNGHQQKNCRFYEKSNGSERCMYYVFDEYCDCLPAQKSARHQLQ